MLSEERRTEGTALTQPASGRLASPGHQGRVRARDHRHEHGPPAPGHARAAAPDLELDGETVVRCDPVMGYLHRSKEKISENRMYPAVIPITDRIDYMNNMAMEYGYCLAVEKLLDVEIPPRADAIRALMNEFSRIMSHIPS
jgi:NADH-quinone oxidoreductase subunit D